jgi:hypothetical protein
MVVGDPCSGNLRSLEFEVNMGRPIRETHGDSLASLGNQSLGELEM